MQPLKGFVSIGFLLLLFLQKTSRAWVVLTYQINKAYIVENLCENREVPLVLCSGKCVVAKQVNEEGGQSENQAPQKQLAQLEACYFEALPHWPVLSYTRLPASIQRPLGAPFLVLPAPAQGIFKPPCIVAFTA